MAAPPDLGRMLMTLGTVVFVAGAWLALAPRLPGDFILRRGNWTLHLPLASCLLASVLLSLLFSLWRR